MGLNGLPNAPEAYLEGQREAAGSHITAETIAMVRNIRDAELKRSITLGIGLIGYDLKAPSEIVVPVFTPVVNETPREMGVGVDVHHFKAITSFGWPSAAQQSIPGVVDENSNPGSPAYSVAQLQNVFQTIGAANDISFKAVWRGRQLEGDMRSKRMSELLYILKLIEEQWLIYYSDYLWAPATPLAPTTAATGGSIAANTYYFAVSAINAQGETFATKCAGPVTTTGSTSTISITFFTQPLATGYNIYVSTTGTGSSWGKQVAANFASPSGALPTQTIPNLNGSMTVVLSSLTTGSVALPSANTATVAISSVGSNPLTFNGIMGLIFGAGNANYSGGSPTSSFTAAGQPTSGITLLGQTTMAPLVIQPAASTGKLAYSDLTNLLLYMFQQARANPDWLAVSPQDNNDVTNLLIGQAGARLNLNVMQPDAMGNLLLGQRVTQMMNPTTGKIIQVKVWPFLPQGTMIFGSDALPYPIPGFDGPPRKVLTNIEYYGFDYPPTKSNPLFSFADYVDETLEISFLGGYGAITGIIA